MPGQRQGGRKILLIAKQISLSLQLLVNLSPHERLVEVDLGFAYLRGCSGELRHLEQEAGTVPKLKFSGSRVLGHGQPWDVTSLAHSSRLRRHPGKGARSLPPSTGRNGLRVLQHQHGPADPSLQHQGVSPFELGLLCWLWQHGWWGGVAWVSPEEPHGSFPYLPTSGEEELFQRVDFYSQLSR